MCRVCKDSFKVTQEQFLKNVAAEIKDGTDAEHFKDVLDAVLGTGMVDEDQEKAAEWEKGNRST